MCLSIIRNYINSFWQLQKKEDSPIPVTESLIDNEGNRLSGRNYWFSDMDVREFKSNQISERG
jgi:hypothetical protein